MAIVEDVIQGDVGQRVQVIRYPRVLVTVAEVAPELLACSRAFIQGILKPNILLSTVWKDEIPTGFETYAADLLYVYMSPHVDVLESYYVDILQYTRELTYPLPAVTFESMMFLFPRWDMDSFPGGVLT